MIFSVLKFVAMQAYIIINDTVILIYDLLIQYNLLYKFK